MSELVSSPAPAARPDRPRRRKLRPTMTVEASPVLEVYRKLPAAHLRALALRAAILGALPDDDLRKAIGAMADDLVAGLAQMRAIFDSTMIV